MKLSILDQAPVSVNMSAGEALKNSVKLAELGDELGYTRFWLAEHHGMNDLSSSAPEVTLGGIGMVTESIRLGSGATLLPYYKPYKVAEVFNTLASLYGDRIDIGIGRAPGGDNKASEALSDNYLQHVFKMPDLVSELQSYINNDEKILKAMPLPDNKPELWMLGTSEKSAIFARDNNMNYCFGKFMSSSSPKDVLNTYRENGSPGEIIVTVNVFCHADEKYASELARSYAVNQALKSTGRAFDGIAGLEDTAAAELTEDEEKETEKILSNLIIGTPETVGKELADMSKDYRVDEFMIVTITHNIEDKLNSYRLLAEHLLKQQ